MGEPDTTTSDLAVSPTRELTGLARTAFAVLATVIAASHLWFNTFSTMSELWRSALHFGLFGMAAAMLYPAFRTTRARALTFGIDICLGAGAFACGIYLLAHEVTFYAGGATSGFGIGSLPAAAWF